MEWDWLSIRPSRLAKCVTVPHFQLNYPCRSLNKRNFKSIVKKRQLVVHIRDPSHMPRMALSWKSVSLMEPPGAMLRNGILQIVKNRCLRVFCFPESLSLSHRLQHILVLEPGVGYLSGMDKGRSASILSQQPLHSLTFKDRSGRRNPSFRFTTY